MIMLMNSTLISVMIPMVVLVITAMISKKVMNDREKSPPFECGFDPKSSARMPFSLQFFLIAVILIFDVEIALILPIVIIMNVSSMITWTKTTLYFILVLLGGLYHEWNQGALKWAE